MPHVHFAGVCLELRGSPALQEDLLRLYRAYVAPPCARRPILVTLGAERLPPAPVFELSLGEAWLSLVEGASAELLVGAARNFHQVDRLLMHGAAALLVREGAILVHGAAVESPHGAIAFVGPSGAGKTTAALNCPGRVLHRDRVAIGVSDDGCWLAPVPFLYGEPSAGGVGRLPLALLAFVEKGGHNALSPLSPGQAAARLLAATLIPPEPAIAGLALALADRISGMARTRILRARKGGGFWPLLLDRVACGSEVD